MKKQPSEFRHNNLIKSHRCIQVQDIFNCVINEFHSPERYARTIKELDDKNIDYYTKTTIVYYLPK